MYGSHRPSDGPRIGSHNEALSASSQWLARLNSADGFRKVLADEYDNIYVYNLRGNQRTGGEQSKREGGKIFGAGSRNTVAITLLIRTGAERPCQVLYHDIGDYLSREEKLRIVAESDLSSLAWVPIKPNDMATSSTSATRTTGMQRSAASHAGQLCDAHL